MAHDVDERGMELAGDRAAMLARLRRGGIRDAAVLRAMARVPREEFVAEGHEHAAYADRALPIAEGQTISQPLMVGHMLQALALRPGERVLDVGTGSGYQAALLAEMGAAVVSVERLVGLARAAERRLHRLGYQVDVRVGDGSTGVAEDGRFDVVVCAAVAPQPPRSLVAALAPGGRLVIPLRRGSSVSGERLYRFRRRAAADPPGDRFSVEDLGACRFVPLLGLEGYSPAAPG